MPIIEDYVDMIAAGIIDPHEGYQICSAERSFRSCPDAHNKRHDNGPSRRIKGR